MCADDIPLAELRQLRHYLADLRRTLHHVVGDVVHLDGIGRNAHTGIDHGVELVDDLVIHADLDRRNFDDAVLGGVQAGGFNVEHDVFAVGALIVRFGDDHAVIVDQIPLHAGDELDVLAALFKFFDGIEGLRVGLHHAVVGDGDGLVSPFRSALDECGRRGHRVHGGHLRVQVQLHALDLLLVLAGCKGHLLHIVHHEGQLFGKVVPLAVAAHLDADAGLDAGDLLALAVFGREKGLAQNRTGVIGHAEGKQRLYAPAQLLALDLGQHKALDAHAPAGFGQIADGVVVALRDLAAVEHLGAVHLLFLLGQLAHLGNHFLVQALAVLQIFFQRDLLLTGNNLHGGLPAEHVPDHLGKLPVHAAHQHQIRSDLAADGQRHGIALHCPLHARQMRLGRGHFGQQRLGQPPGVFFRISHEIVREFGAGHRQIHLHAALFPEHGHQAHFDRGILCARQHARGEQAHHDARLFFMHRHAVEGEHVHRRLGRNFFQFLFPFRIFGHPALLLFSPHSGLFCFFSLVKTTCRAGSESPPDTRFS